MAIRFKGDMTKVVAKNKGDMSKTTLRKRAAVIQQIINGTATITPAADYYTKMLLHFDDGDRAADVTISSINKAFCAVLSPDKTKIYVAANNGSSGTGISVINATNYTKIKSISTPSPWVIQNLVISPVGDKLYASSSNPADAASGRILIIDLSTDAVTACDCYNPSQGLDITKNGKFVFFGTQGSNPNYSSGLWVLNTTTNIVNLVSSTGNSRMGIAISPDGTKLITSYSKNYLLYSINQDTGTTSLLTSISAGIGSGGDCPYTAKTSDDVWFSSTTTIISKFNWSSQSVTFKNFSSSNIPSNTLYAPISVTDDEKTLYVSSYTGTCYSVNTTGFTMNGTIAGNAPGGVLAIGNNKLLMLNNSTNVAVLKDLTSFSDLAQSPLTQHRIGTLATSATQSKFGGKSLALNGTNTNKLQFANPKGKAINFGSSNWTMEGWFWFNQKNIGYQPIIVFTNFDGNYPGPELYLEGNNCLTMAWRADSAYGARSAIGSSFNPDANRWYHIAVVRNGGTVTMYVDGTSVGSQAVSGNIYNPDYIGLGVFGHAQYITHFNGYMDGIRIQVGEAVYTGNFTAPTSAPTANSYTKLLMNFDSTIRDETTSSLYSYAVGSTAVISSAQSKFGGSSLKMSGGTYDYVKIHNESQPIALFDRPFTIEGWFYNTGNSHQPIINMSSGGATQGPVLGIHSDNALIFAASNTGSTWDHLIHTAGFAPTKNAWHHVAVVREYKAGPLKLYCDGVLRGTVSTSASLFTSENIWVGHYPYIDGNTPVTFSGYIDEVRILLDTCSYGVPFTPPTSQLSASTNTKLMLNFNSDYADSSTGPSTVTAYGGAVLSSAQSKFGGNSMKFTRSTGSRLTVSNAGGKLQFGSSDFCIETWLYLNSVPGGLYPDCFFILGYGADNSAAGFDYFLGTTDIVVAPTNYSSPLISAPHGMTTNKWYHVALSRKGERLNVFIDGVLKGSASISGAVYAIPSTGANANMIAIGSGEPGAATAGNFDGYMDDFRITIGDSVYSSTFPSTAPFTLIG